MTSSVYSHSQKFMEIALSEAEEAAQREEVPVGAVIVDSQTMQVLAAASNRTEELNDATAHAEMLALREAAKVFGAKRLINCDLYVTLEPCTMCAAAISMARIRRLYYGASDLKSGGIENGVKFFSPPSCHHRPEVYSGMNELRSKNLLKTFFKSKR